MPITWRNVEAANPALAGAAMGAAAQTTNGAFDIFSKLIQQRQALEQSNFAAVDEANKQGYLDALAGAKTPEEVAALQQSGKLDTMRQSLTAASRGAVRSADEARTTAVRQNSLAELGFKDTMLNRAEAPILAQHNVLVASGDIKGAEAFRLSNPQVRDWSGATQKAYDTGRVRAGDVRTDATNTRTDALAVATQPNLLAAQAQLTATQGIRDLLNTQSLDIQGSTQTAQQQAASDAQELRRLTAVQSEEALRNDEQMRLVGSLHKRVAQAAGINVVNSQGLPDFANMDSKQLASFDAKAKEMGIPASSVATNGDTARGDAFLRRVVDSKQFSPHIIAANEAALRATVNSTAPGVVGNDAAAMARATAENTVGFDNADANSWYGAGSDNARKSYGALAGRVKDLLADNSTGFSKGEDIDAVQKLLGEVAASGVKTKSGQYVVPSANDMERFIRSSEGGWFRDAERAENIKKELLKWLDSPEGSKQVSDGEKSIAYRQKQKILQMQRDLLNPPAQKK